MRGAGAVGPVPVVPVEVPVAPVDDVEVGDDVVVDVDRLPT